MIMKISRSKLNDEKGMKDDSLFGLLLSYKSYVTYFRILISEEKKRLSVQMTDNPKKWSLISEERFEDFYIMRRIKLGLTRLSVKYLTPEHIVRYMGSMLGIKQANRNIEVVNNLDKDGYYILVVPLKMLPQVSQNIKKIINLSPQKKYEIIEKCLAEDSQG